MVEKLAHIFVAGVNGNTLPAEVVQLLGTSKCQLFCSSSLLDTVMSVVPTFRPKRWSSIVPIADCFKKIQAASVSEPTLILTSGDPLFYGLGKKLRQQLPERNITFLPSISYMQSCFAHFGLAWDDADITSLHGRSIRVLDSRLNSSKLFIFTDPENSPNRIASYLLERLDSEDRESVLVMTGECIGKKNERFSSSTLEEAAERTYAHPNCMIIANPAVHHLENDFTFGLGEEDIAHSRGLITKNEVRAAVLHKLRLTEHGVFWDIGAGSGSISLESARMYPGLTVNSFEKNPEQLLNIRANKQRFGCRNLHIIAGEVPETFAGYVRADRVFIGGSGGRLEEIITALKELNSPPERIVITAVLEKTAREAPEILHHHGYHVDISLIQVKRYVFPAAEETEFNPIHIICGRREK